MNTLSELTKIQVPDADGQMRTVADILRENEALRHWPQFVEIDGHVREVVSIRREERIAAVDHLVGKRDVLVLQFKAEV